MSKKVTVQMLSKCQYRKTGQLDAFFRRLQYIKTPLMVSKRRDIFVEKLGHKENGGRILNHIL
jgi:hypothetical protein